MKIVIDGKQIDAAPGATILDTARENGVYIPSLCYLKNINHPAACRVCLVEVSGQNALQCACSTKAAEGMEVVTDSPRIRLARRKSLELMCSDHKMDCTNCPRRGGCELRTLAKEYEVDENAYGIGRRKAMTDSSTPYLVRDNAKCVLCRRCVSACKEQGIGAISIDNRGGETTIGFAQPLSETDCVGCGACVAACPTGALSVRDGTKSVWKALLGRNKIRTAALVSPYVCQQIGKMFGEEKEQDNTGKTAAMLHRIGFDEIYLTGENVAVCPAWRTYLLKHNAAAAESLPADGQPWTKLAEAYRHEYQNENVHVTIITPCTAAKGLGNGPWDAAITTTELGEMWYRACVSSFTACEMWRTLPEEMFDRLPIEETDKKTYTDGLGKARELFAQGRLEGMNVLACPGGCLHGGGCPRPDSLVGREDEQK
jgi:iron only hydrogenase large subunit-like protein/ferredoxin